MDDALFGANPPQLAVRDKISPCLAPILDEVVEVLALDAVGEELDGFADNLVAATDGEGLAVRRGSADIG